MCFWNFYSVPLFCLAFPLLLNWSSFINRFWYLVELILTPFLIFKSILRIPWTAKRSNQSIQKHQPWIFIGRTDAEAEALILWPPDAMSQLIRKDWLGCWERLRAGGEGGRGWEGYSITDSVDMNLGKLWETVEDRGAWHAGVHGVTKSWKRLSNWTTTECLGVAILFIFI